MTAPLGTCSPQSRPHRASAMNEMPASHTERACGPQETTPQCASAPRSRGRASERGRSLPDGACGSDVRG